MNDTTPLSCPSCGKPLPVEASHGLCPRCVLQGVIADSPPPVDETLESVRAQFPELEIHELIGVGGMGRVYRARDPLVDRIVALKILSPERALDPEWIERFTREARALARLNHPHIVQVHRFGSTPQPHLVMEYVDGVNLRQAMEAGGLSAREALVIVPKLCDALHYAHEHGVLHRDIKPENILIDSEGRVKIVDFGLAKLRDEGVLHFTLTQSGAKLGTLAYMAPEQVENPSDVDHRADLYSLGVVFYEMLTGELPLGRFPSPSEANGTDPRLDAVVLRTLEKKREKRFPDAGAMRTEIESAATGPVPVKAENWNELNYEYRSPIEWRGWPLLHVAFGKDEATGKMKHARGIVAIGGIATGGLAMGVMARGLVSFGVLSIGVISSGVLSIAAVSLGVVGLAALCASSVIAVAPFAFGVNALGWISAGVKAFGKHTADIDGPISLTAATVADRWSPSLMSLQLGSVMIGMTVFMLCAAAAAWKASNRPIFALYLALSLIGPVSILPAVQTKLPSYTELYQKQEAAALQRAEENAKKVAATKYRQTIDLAQRWMAEVSRTDDPKAKERAIAEMLKAVQSDDPVRIDAALLAVRDVSEVDTDKTQLRDAIRTHLEHEDEQIRGNAILALLETNYDTSDVSRILALVADASDDDLYELGWALYRFSNRDFTGQFAEPMFGLLKKGFAADCRHEKESDFQSGGLLNAVWGAKVTPEIEALLVEWSRLDDPDGRSLTINSRGNDALYNALSTIDVRSTAAVERLLELAQNPDGNISGRALMGLHSAKPSPEDRRRIATGIIRLLDNRNETYWQEGLLLIPQFATAEHLPALRELAAREELSNERRKSLEQIIARLSP